MRTDLSESCSLFLCEYTSRLKSFKPNACLYLISIMINGVAMGIFRLLFNFYVLSLGFNEALLGNLITVSSLTALLSAIPMGYLSDILGRKKSLLVSGLMTGLSMLIAVLWAEEGILYAMNMLFGTGQSLGAVTMSPFLMENREEGERTYLFSFSSGLQMTMFSVGNWIGGYLPAWISQFLLVSTSSRQSYGGALLVTAIITGLSVLPLLLLRSSVLKRSERSGFTPIAYAVRIHACWAN